MKTAIIRYFPTALTLFIRLIMFIQSPFHPFLSNLSFKKVFSNGNLR
jgi:hypothetical protein